MELIIIENAELTKIINEVNSLLDSSQIDKYKIIPKNIEFNYGQIEVWFGAITAIHTVVQIIQFGSNAVNQMVKKRELVYKKDHEIYEVSNVKESNNEYTISIEDRDIKISVTKIENSYSVKVENIDEFVS